MTNRISYLLIRIINVSTALICTLIMLRILARLVNANPSTPIINFINQLSGYFMSPFNGIFPNLSIGTGSIIDVPAIIAILGYALIAMLLIAIISAVTPATSDTTTVREEDPAYHHQSHV